MPRISITFTRTLAPTLLAMAISFGAVATSPAPASVAAPAPTSAAAAAPANATRSAVGTTARPAPLPKQHIESVYRNGDIDSVIFYLKQGREKPMFLDKDDSVLAFKYLGIIYATDKDKREKGRYYFNQMLRLDPGASITELLPGESARTIFKEVREEFFELNPTAARKPAPVAASRASSPADVAAADADDEKPGLPPATPLAAPAATVKPGRSHAVWWWVAGGAFLAGAAGITVVAVLDGPVETHAIHD